MSAEVGAEEAVTQHTGQVVYLSFLGIGRYEKTQYRWADQLSAETPYVQDAQLGLLMASGVITDAASVLVVVMGTEQARHAHWQTNGLQPREENGFGGGLKPRLEARGFSPLFQEIPQQLDSQSQWTTFRAVLDQIPDGARLIVDMTHGFRAVPVVLSSALHFLKLTRGLRLLHVLYGAKSDGSADIYDYADFYEINDWSEAVSRLVDEADARKLAELAQRPSGLMTGFHGTALAEALQELTDTIRNVAVNRVEPMVQRALTLVKQAMADADAAGQTASSCLLKLVTEKFGELAATPPLTGVYDRPYLEVQLKLIDLLIEHRLFLQASIVLMEAILSIGMLVVNRAQRGRGRYSTDVGMDVRKRYTEVFKMLVKEGGLYDPDLDEEMAHGVLKPWYDMLDQAGLTEQLAKDESDLSAVRNGFVHGWSTQPIEHLQPEKVVKRTLKSLTDLVQNSTLWTLVGQYRAPDVSTGPSRP